MNLLTAKSSRFLKMKCDRKSGWGHEMFARLAAPQKLETRSPLRRVAIARSKQKKNGE